MKKLFIILFTLFLLSCNCFAGMPAFLPAVKSIQEVSVTLSGTSGTAPLSPTVDATYSAVELVSWGTIASGMDDLYVYGSITASNTLTATRIGSTGSPVVRFRVTEFYPYAIKAIQSGNVATYAGGSPPYLRDKDITAVTLKRSKIYFAGASSQDTGVPSEYYDIYPHIYFKDTDTITFACDGAEYTRGYYYVVELQPWVCP